MQFSASIPRCFALLVACFAFAAGAADQAAPSLVPVRQPVAVATSPNPAPPASSDAATTRRNPFGSKPMTAAVLATKRGGDRVFNDAQLKGVVSDNQATNVVTGMNVISDGAFAGSAGLSTVIQNSGNNVLIQNATIINVQLK